MKIAILSRRGNLYSTARLVATAKKRGHEVKVIDTLRCYMNISQQSPLIHYKGHDLDDFDAIIPRIGASITFYGCAVVRQFEMMGTFTVNKSMGITRSRDKLRAMQLLSRHALGLPKSGFAHSPDDIDDLIHLVGGAPLVIKLIEGTQGIGVILAETTQAAQSVVQAFIGLKVNILVQEYIKESRGRDIRCFVIGDKVVAAMQRTAPPGEFRANVHRGGTAKAVRLTSQERKAAIKATKILGLNVAGVDILRSNRGPLVLEVNSSPGLKGIEAATGKDVAAMIIQFIEKNAKRMSKRSRYEG